MTSDGGNFQRVIAVQLAVRTNHEAEPTTLRFLIHPSDGATLAESLLHTAAWLAETEKP